MPEDPSLPAPSGPWDESLLAPIIELNERLLDTLHRLALRPECAGTQVHDAGGPAPAPDGHLGALLPPLLAEWRALEGPLQRRLAGCPYLLMDARFGSGAHWEQWRVGGPPGVPSAPSRYFRGAEGVALVRRALLLAWHLSRSNPLGAHVVLGMSASAAQHIGACSLHQLDVLAEQLPAWIAPRWEQQPAVWRQLLRAALSAESTALRTVQLRGLQLLAAPARG